MCGILGLINTDGNPIRCGLLNAMTSSLRHRGPDDQGIEDWGAVGLGHRRLAIIDLKGGKQPLSNEDGQIWISYNGEIYNYQELRRVLEARGHFFKTNSDTETIVHAYEEWGDRCVEYFRGMFAFGIVDFRERRIFLARDHLGIKPLYFFHSITTFAFASEIQSLRFVPNQKLSLDLEAIDQYLWLQYIPAPKTAFKEIHKLPPAHRMSVSFDGRIFGPEQYWFLEFCPNYRRTEGEWLDAFEEVLFESVKAHLISDVSFGAFLSGGVDSSAVVAYMSQILDKPVKTFTIGFNEEDYNEIRFAEKASQRWGTDHHIEIVRPNALEILPQLVEHYGEPFGDSSAIPTYYVSQIARRYVPMILSGDGGDESFGGYNSYLSWMGWLGYEDIQRGSAVNWRKFVIPVLRRLPSNLFPSLSRKPTLSNWLRFISYIARGERQSLWRQEYADIFPSSIELFEREYAIARKYPPGNMVQYMDIKTYLPFDILTKVDIASMMHGLEVRTPIVDIRVVEFAATIPEQLVICKNGRGVWEGKMLFKEVMKKYYSTQFLHRPKMGFGVPIQNWFAPDGVWRDNIGERLLGKNSMLLEFFQGNQIRKFLKVNSSGPLWLLIFLEEWLQQNRESISIG